MIYIEASEQIRHFADCETPELGSCHVIKARTKIGACEKLSSISGLGGLLVGVDSFVPSKNVQASGFGISVGGNVLAAENCILAARNYDSPIPTFRTAPRVQLSRDGIAIEDNVSIAASTMLLGDAPAGRRRFIALCPVERGPVAVLSLQSGKPLGLLGYRVSG